MGLRWTAPAANDLYNIVRQQDNPAVASEVAETLYDGCGSLSKFPYLDLGRNGRIPGSRELVFPGLPYIYHGAQDRP
jgi:toxin ParE1/3/4